MTTRNAVVTSIVALALAAAPALHATPLHIMSPIHAAFGKPKTVKITLRNVSATTLDLKVGDNQMSIEAGKTLNLQLPIGTRVVTNTATNTMAAGTLVAEVSTALDGATLSIK